MSDILNPVYNNIHIDISSIEGSGLLFVRSLDPINKLILSISDTEFSSIGFYYTSSATGIKQIHIALLTIFECKKPSWLNHGNIVNTLEELVSNNLVESIAIRKLKPVTNGDGVINTDMTESLEDIFKTSIVKVISNSSNMEIEPKDLFTKLLHDGDSTIKILLSEIIELVELELKNLVLGISSDGECETIIDCQSDIGYSDIYENNVLMSTMFDDITYVKLPERNRSLVTKLIHPRAIGHIKQFITLLLEDDEFLNDVTSSISKNNKHNEVYRLEKNRLIINLIQICNDLLSIINSGIEEGYIDYSNINVLADKYNIILSKSGDLIDRPVLNPINMTNIQLDKVVKFGSHNPNINFDGSLTMLRDYLECISLNITNNGTPTININDIILHVNNLIKFSGSSCNELNIIPESTSYKSIIVVDTNDNVKLSLSNGNKMTLTCKNYDLSSYTKSDLMEILVTLDVRVANDTRYDELRHDITNKIANCKEL